MAVPDYDVTIGDVDAFLIWDVEESTQPTRAQIEAWIPLGSAELAARLGALEGTCNDAAFTARARHVVALFAAAMAEDAHYPERAVRRDEGSYGALLWQRWRELTAQLVADVEDCRNSGDAEGGRGGAGHGFPDPPLFTRLMGT